VNFRQQQREKKYLSDPTNHPGTRSLRRGRSALVLLICGWTLGGTATAVARRKFGSGTACYIGPDIGRGYTRDNLPRVARLVGRLLRDASQPPVEFDAPKNIEVTALRPSENRMVLHLLNVTALASNTRKMATLANIGIQINQGQVKKARLVIGDAELGVRNNHFVVPSVGHSEMVVLDL